jgi:hypothetical protein
MIDQVFKVTYCFLQAHNTPGILDPGSKQFCQFSCARICDVNISAAAN